MKYARELTTLVAAPFAVWIVGWSHAYVFDGAVGLIAGLALHEFLILGERKGFRVPKTLCLAVVCSSCKPRRRAESSRCFLRSAQEAEQERDQVAGEEQQPDVEVQLHVGAHDGHQGVRAVVVLVDPAVDLEHEREG